MDLAGVASTSLKPHELWEGTFNSLGKVKALLPEKGQVVPGETKMTNLWYIDNLKNKNNNP